MAKKPTTVKRAVTKRVGRPKSESAKVPISIRIAPDLLTKIKKVAEKKGLPYQTFVHELLVDKVR